MIKKFLGLLFLFIVINESRAQNFTEQLSTLQTIIVDVTYEDYSIEQSIEKGESECLLTLTVHEIEDDRLVYKFNASDINEHKIKFDTKKNEVIISGETKGGKDLILLNENDESTEYTDQFELFAKDIETARGIVDGLKKMVSGCDTRQSEVSFSLGSNQSFSGGVKYLTTNLPQTVKIPDSQFDQLAKSNQDFLPLLTFEIKDVDDDELITYRFNINDISPNSIGFDTNKGHVFITGEVKGGRNLIEVYENGEKDNYADKFLFYMDNIENARKMVAVLKYLNEESDAYISSHVSEIANLKTLNDYIRYLENSVDEVSFADEAFDQVFKKIQEESPVVSLGIKDQSDATLTEYIFNLADLNDNQINFDTKRNSVIITLPIRGGNKLIKTFKNSELENYEDEIIIYAEDVEDARLLTTAFKNAVEQAQEQFKELLKKYESMPDKELRDLLSQYVKDITIDEDSYEQKLTTDVEDACKIVLDGADVSKGESYSYKFNLLDINSLAVEYTTKSEEVFVNLETIGDKDLIEYSEEGVVEGFEKEMIIRAENVEEARLMALILKKLAEKCQE